MEYERVVSMLEYIKENIERWWLWVNIKREHKKK
jgi:hypothetical protein